ncbi:MAG: AAA family ATPase [Candidatus Rokubacteria bacterium]|nr:AAA family ATPase [Candidatus Rokubacteria bacterium]
MKCQHCQTENPAGMKFCGQCATPLVSTCPSCRTANPTDNKFCGQCASPLGAPVQQRFASPETFTPKHLAEKILTSRSALEGERKQVTVLFADLKGSMELLADRDPEEARKILDPVLELMMDAIHRYEGTVNQVMGDGIMALFGAPLAHEDHAVRACYAALRMQEAVKRYGDEVRRTEGVPIQIRVGLNSGEVVVRSIGSDLRMDYSAIGQTTHLAARMEQAATPGSILMSAGTLRLAEGYVHLRPLGAVAIKGLGEPVEVYELTGAAAARGRLQAAAARGLSRFVGRDAELETLRQALDNAREGHGQIVGVVGEPGVGKSRLFYEFVHSHRTQGWLILESSSVSYGKATPCLPVIDLLKAYFQIQDRDDARKIREKVSGKLITLDEALMPALTAVLALLDVAVDDPQWQALDPPQRRQRTFEVCKRLLLRESRVQPLLLVFEDLHWIDSETQAFLDGLVESVPTARLLLLVNYRPEYQHGWGSKTYYTQLRIDPLPPASAEELLDALLGPESALRPLKRLLIERTEGNPLFLEESARNLLETHVLSGGRGAYRLMREVTAIEVAPTVQAVLAARIDRLRPEDKNLLQSAAVIGETVPFPLLRAIAELPEDELPSALSRLQSAEFLYEAGLFPDIEYTFKHGLTYQVAYSSLLQERRRTLHAKIVGVIERLYPGRLAEHAERLAHHAFRGELWEEAVTYLRQAGAKTLARSANREAVAYFEQALAALAHLPETRETLEQGIDLRFELRAALFPLAEFERIRDCLREAERLARALDDQRRLGWVSVYLSHYFSVIGGSTQGRRFGQDAHTIAESLGDLPLRIGATLYVGTACQLSGDHRPAREYLRKTLQLLEGDLSRERFGLHGFPAVIAGALITWLHGELGDFSEGIAYGQQGIRTAEAIGHPYSLTFQCWGLGQLHRIKGDFDEATRVLERALALCHEWNLDILSPLVNGALGSVYARSGRVAEGLSLLHQAVEFGEAIRLGYYHPLTVADLGEVCALAGRLDDALARAGQGLALARERGQRGYEAWTLRLAGEIASYPDRLDGAAAEGHYRQAMVLADELGMRPLVAHCHLGLGKLYRRAGKAERAREHLTTAATMFREMDMGFWLDQAEAVMTGISATELRELA